MAQLLSVTGSLFVGQTALRRRRSHEACILAEILIVYGKTILHVKVFQRVERKILVYALYRFKRRGLGGEEKLCEKFRIYLIVGTSDTYSVIIGT